MKNVLYLILAVLFVPSIATGQTKSEEIQKTLSLKNKPANTVLILANINGNINVRQGNQDQVSFTVNKTIKAKSEEYLQEGWEKTRLHFNDRGDTILVYIESPCQKFTTSSKNNDRGWWYESDCRDNDCEEKWQYEHDFAVTVPESVNLNVSTINDGNIEVNGVTGNISAHHINGDITVNGAAGPVNLYTINGDITIDYIQLPSKESSYYTLNGDINAYFPSGLSADMYFKSFNGDFYTNINEIQNEPVVKKVSTKKEGTAYKMNVKSNIKARSGGVQLDFETFNGNVYVKEKIN